MRPRFHDNSRQSLGNMDGSTLLSGNGENLLEEIESVEREGEKGMATRAIR